MDRIDRRPATRPWIRMLALTLVAGWNLGVGCYSFSAVSSSITNAGADPSLLLDGSNLYAYTTSRSGDMVPVHRAISLSSGTWTNGQDAMGEAAIWANTLKPFWAPDVVKRGNTYYLFYTAFVSNYIYNGNGKEHAIGVACSSNPDGPFNDCGVSINGGFDVPLVRDPACTDSNPATICQGVIDAEVVAQGSTDYLLWSLDWGPQDRASGTTRRIQGCRLNAARNACVSGTTSNLIEASETWERGTVENPTMIQGPEGDFHLHFSGGNYENAYATGGAICSGPLGPCHKGNRPCFKDGSFSGVQNPGGLDLVDFSSTTAIGVIHAGPDFSHGSADPRRMRTLIGSYQTWNSGDPVPCMTN